MGFLLATIIGGLIVYHQKTLREYERMQPDYRRKLALEANVFDRELAQLLSRHRSLVEGSMISDLPRVDADEMTRAYAEVDALLNEDPLNSEFAKLENGNASQPGQEQSVPLPVEAQLDKLGAEPNLRFMEKWADYGISCVKYTSDGDSIATAGVRTDEGTKFGEQKIWHRSQVVEALGEGKSFVTIYKETSDAKWSKGASVGTVSVGGVTFIRTDSNNTAKDNLGSLPEC